MLTTPMNHNIPESYNPAVFQITRLSLSEIIRPVFCKTILARLPHAKKKLSILEKITFLRVLFSKNLIIPSTIGLKGFSALDCVSQLRMTVISRQDAQRRLVIKSI